MREPEQRVYQCDRCGKFFAFEEQHGDVGHPYHEKAIQAEFSRPNTSVVAADLCGNCAEEMKRFLSGKPLIPAP